MSKIIDIIRKGTPEDEGYFDHVVVLDGGVELFSGAISTEPNPYKPLNHRPWHDVYARIAEGDYVWKCIPDHDKYGRCLLINNGGIVRTLNPNSNHNSEYMATQIFVHDGYSETWRGSKGCITVPPSSELGFFKCFADNETGKLTIRKGDVV